MERSTATLTASTSWADLWTEANVPDDLRDFEYAPLPQGVDTTEGRHRVAPESATRAWSTPQLCDALGNGARVLEPVLRAFGGRDVYAGPVVTVACSEDSSLVNELVEAPGAGRVLVVDGGERLRLPLLAGAMARRAADNGWAGVIVHGTVRDVEILRTIDLGVHALAPSPIAPQTGGTGSMGVPVTVAGVTIQTGDHVYADADGIVVTEGPCG